MIEVITQAIVDRLEVELGAGVVVASPPGRPGIGGDRVTVLLFRIERDPERTNQPPVVRPTTDPRLPAEREDHVLPLQLHYLVSAHSGDPNIPNTAAQVRAHELLHYAMRALHTASPFRIPYVRAGRPSITPVRISLASLSVEALSDLWVMLSGSAAFWPSAVYLVTNADIVADVSSGGPPVLDARDDVAQVAPPHPEVA